MTYIYFLIQIYGESRIACYGKEYVLYFQAKANMKGKLSKDTQQPDKLISNRYPDFNLIISLPCLSDNKSCVSNGNALEI
jgi:hypothetical protein